MAEIAAVEPNRFKVASLFSGCGGSSLGYRMAGYQIVWANEFFPPAQDTYRLNHPSSILDLRDIRVVQPEEILAATGLEVGQLDLLDGSPPCSSFSTSGHRANARRITRAYSGTWQRTDDLLWEFCRILKGLRPRAFLAENVAGLIKGQWQGLFLEVLQAMKQAGYQVEVRLVDSQWLGVPQMRRRLFFQGVRLDQDRRPAFPIPDRTRHSVRDALMTLDPNPIEPGTNLTGYAIGREWHEIKPGEHSRRYLNLKKPGLDDPCWTITASGGAPGTASVVHPTQPRKFSIAELKRICGFPDDFHLTGSYAQRWERLGRSVPPVMMARLAATIRDEVLT